MNQASSIKHQASSIRHQASSFLILTLILAATAALLFGALHSVAPWSLDVGPDSDEQFVTGFFGAEHDGATTFRWSSPQSQLTLYGAAGRQLHMHLYGNSANQADTQQVKLSTNQEPIGTFAVAGGWRVYRILLPPNTVDGVIPIDLASADHRSSANDNRTLGAASIDWVQVAPLTAGTESWLAPLTRAGLLTWTLALLACALAAAQSTFRRSRNNNTVSISIPPWIILFIACASAVLIAWSWRDPYTLALAVPTPPWWALLIATLALLVWGQFGRETRDTRHETRGVRKDTSRVSSLISGSVALLLHIVISLPLSVGVRGTAALLLLGLPGALLAARWFDDEHDSITNGFLMLCGALTIQQLLIFVLQSLPGPLTWWQLLLVNDFILALLIVSIRRRTKDERRKTANKLSSFVLRLSSHFPLLLVLLLAGCLRFTNLGSAEFQADEIRPMYLAAGVIHGQEGILLLHRKGPTEILLPAGPLVLLGQTTEFVARLPFALAGLGIVLGVYLMARSLFRGRFGAAIGLVAGSIIAVDGFLLAFSRIVQYQSIVVLMGLAAIWCAWRFYAGASAQRYLVGAAVFGAMSMLAHYDGIFIVPALAFLALAGCQRRGWPARRWIAALWPPVVIGLVLLLSFYGPFFFSERFERTTAYLGRRLAEQPAFVETTGGPPFNNLPGYYAIFTFYNTTFQIQWYALVVALAIIIWLAQYVRPQLFSSLLAGALVIGGALLVLAPDRLLLPGGGSLAGIPFALALCALAAAPRTPPGLRLLLLWFTPAFLAEAFLIAKPDTHFYNIHAPAALLIACAIVGALRWLRTRPLAWLAQPLLAVHAVVLLLAIPYLNLLFVRQMPEYESLFPALRPALYQASYGDKRPAGGSFGFPNRSGWKAVGALYETGALGGDFESNGMTQIVGWYTRDVFRCYDRPAYYFVDRMPKNPIKIPIDYVRDAYHLFGYVLVDGVRMLDIYSKAPTSAPPQAFNLDDYLRPFDGQNVSDFPTSRLLTNEIVPQNHLVADWQGGIRLRGYDLDHKSLTTGETAVMSFYWQAAGPIAPGYAVAVQIVDAQGRVVGAGAPYCGGDPPEEWYTQYVNDIAFKVAPNDKMPPGGYTLRVGLRNGQTGGWLPLASGGETVPFTQIQVLAPDHK